MYRAIILILVLIGAGLTGGGIMSVPTGAAGIELQHIADYDGDGRTDFTVARPTGGPNDQVIWYVGPNIGGFAAQPWGIGLDILLAGGDYDGDNKTDITVWRSGAQAFFYILNSSDSTVRAIPFGITGDDPTVEGDYTGDGISDPAVYREGASAGQRSHWYYLASSGPLSGQIVVTQWGQFRDFPAPGDYNGDNKNDFCIMRDDGNGNAVFFEHDGTGGGDVPSTPTVTFWGRSSDRIVPGDYDGDGKTDIAVVRFGGNFNWYILNSSNGSFTAITWGLSAVDQTAQGDYDGDGRTDVAIWRPSPTPGETGFYYNGTTAGPGARQWGLEQDVPVANYNFH